MNSRSNLLRKIVRKIMKYETFSAVPTMEMLQINLYRRFELINQLLR